MVGPCPGVVFATPCSNVGSFSSATADGERGNNDGTDIDCGDADFAVDTDNDGDDEDDDNVDEDEDSRGGSDGTEWAERVLDAMAARAIWASADETRGARAIASMRRKGPIHSPLTCVSIA